MTVPSKGHEMDWQQPTDAENSQRGTKTPFLYGTAGFAECAAIYQPVASAPVLSAFDLQIQMSLIIMT